MANFINESDNLSDQQLPVDSLESGFSQSFDDFVEWDPSGDLSTQLDPSKEQQRLN